MLEVRKQVHDPSCRCGDGALGPCKFGTPAIFEHSIVTAQSASCAASLRRQLFERRHCIGIVDQEWSLVAQPQQLRGSGEVFSIEFPVEHGSEARNRPATVVTRALDVAKNAPLRRLLADSA